MASGKVTNNTIKTKDVIAYIGAQQAGASGYISVDLTDELPDSARIISCDIGLGHLASKMFVGCVTSGKKRRTLYVNYYAPFAVSASLADVSIILSYI